jgi:hypothetical protein
MRADRVLAGKADIATKKRLNGWTEWSAIFQAGAGLAGCSGAANRPTVWYKTIGFGWSTVRFGWLMVGG